MLVRVRTACCPLMLLGFLGASALLSGLIPTHLVAEDWSQLGGSFQRNNVASGKQIPEDWDLATKRNLKWTVPLGSEVWGTPIVHQGQIFVGTNNSLGLLSRYPKEHDLGVLLCLRETDGEFLWQYSCEKHPLGRSVDWPLQGICSSPVAEGNRLWLVDNRGRVVCLDTEGFRDDEDDGPEQGVRQELFRTSANLRSLIDPQFGGLPYSEVLKTIKAIFAQVRIPLQDSLRVSRLPEGPSLIIESPFRNPQFTYRIEFEDDIARILSLGQEPRELAVIGADLLDGLEQGIPSSSLVALFNAEGLKLSDQLQAEFQPHRQVWTISVTTDGDQVPLELSVKQGLLTCSRQITTNLDHEADVVWVLDMMSELGVRQHNMANCAPTIYGDILFVSTSNGVDESHLTLPAAEAPSFLAIQKQTGKVLWSDSSPGENILHGQWSSPAVGVLAGVPQVIFAGGDGWLYSFRADYWSNGKPELLWKFDCNPKTSEWVLGGRGRRTNIVATPVIAEDRVYIAVGDDPEHGEGPGHLWCIDPSQRGDVSPTLVVDRQGQPVAPRRVQALDVQNGEREIPNPNSALLWEYSQKDRNNDGQISEDEQMHRCLGSPAIHQGLLVIADLAGYVHCLDAKSGTVHWTLDLQAQCWSSPLIIENRVYLGDQDGDIAVIPLTTDSMQASASLVPGKTMTLDRALSTVPVVANDVLYLATRGHLIAVSSEQE